jgi:ABC-type enterobactin transport system permease subunit
MWDKLNKLSVQVIISTIVVLASYLFLYVLAVKPVPPENAKLIDILGGIIIGSTLTAVMGWLFTTSKHNGKPQP